jgi:hypothetical protein
MHSSLDWLGGRKGGVGGKEDVGQQCMHAVEHLLHLYLLLTHLQHQGGGGGLNGALWTECQGEVSCTGLPNVPWGGGGRGEGRGCWGWEVGVEQGKEWTRCVCRECECLCLGLCGDVADVGSIGQRSAVNVMGVLYRQVMDVAQTPPVAAIQKAQCAQHNAALSPQHSSLSLKRLATPTCMTCGRSDVTFPEGLRSF